MKRILMLITFIVMASAQAQIINSFQGRSDIENRVFKTIKAIDDASYSQMESLDLIQLVRLSRMLDAALSTLNNQSPPTGNGGYYPPIDGEFEIIVAKKVIVDMITAMGSVDNKSQTFDAMVKATNLDFVRNIPSTCNTANNHTDRNNCKLASMNAVAEERTIVDLATVKKILSACGTTPNTHQDRNLCFAAGIKAAASTELSATTAGCASIASPDGRSLCYSKTIAQ